MSLNTYRDEKGLVKSVEHKFKPDGTVDWRAMIGTEHLFPNKDWFEFRNKSVPKSIDGLNDSQLLIKLGGIKELAKLRGYTSVHYHPIRCENEYVAMKCSIEWIPNYESDFKEIYFEDVANATVNNASNFAVKFLETIAANRAFVRAVRNFLNIHIVGSDEIDSSNSKVLNSDDSEGSETSLPSSQGMLLKTAKTKGYSSFEEFKSNYLDDAVKHNIYSNKNASNWSSFSDIPAKEARILISMLNN